MYACTYACRHACCTRACVGRLGPLTHTHTLWHMSSINRAKSVCVGNDRNRLGLGLTNKLHLLHATAKSNLANQQQLCLHLLGTTHPSLEGTQQRRTMRAPKRALDNDRGNDTSQRLQKLIIPKAPYDLVAKP